MENKFLAECGGTPIYKVSDGLYLFKWKYGEIDMMEVHQIREGINKLIPSGAKLVALPDLCDLKKIDIDDLKLIKSIIDKRISEFEEEIKNDTNKEDK